MNIQNIINDKDFIDWLIYESGIWNYEVNREWLIEGLKKSPEKAQEFYEEYLDYDLLKNYEW